MKKLLRYGLIGASSYLALGIAYNAGVNNAASYFLGEEIAAQQSYTQLEELTSYEVLDINHDNRDDLILHNSDNTNSIFLLSDNGMLERVVGGAFAYFSDDSVRGFMLTRSGSKLPYVGSKEECDNLSRSCGLGYLNIPLQEDSTSTQNLNLRDVEKLDF